MSKRAIEIYDTTLRDGSQAIDVAFSADDKIRIAHKLDELGVHFIEGGWPGSNPKDIEFFRAMKKAPPVHAKVVAFGSTRKAALRVQNDPNLQALLKADTEVITIFGKSWALHVSTALGISRAKNLELISDSIDYLRSHDKSVIYDAEHFFDGFKADPDYALQTLERAAKAGATRLVLCDTNGAAMPWEIREIVTKVSKETKTPLGIHAHNDGEMAVANSLMAVRSGATQVQGTINGIGERCGNANLCSIAPNLKLKMGRECLTSEQLQKLHEVSRFVYEIANLPPDKRQPYVGEAAFTHKGGVHIHAVEKHPATYEHVTPEAVGNRRRLLISDSAGRSAVAAKAKDFNLSLSKTSPQLDALLRELKDREHQGFQFEGAEGSFELLMRKAIGSSVQSFELLGFRVIVEKRAVTQGTVSEATIMVRVGDRVEHCAADGNGPVHALDNALRKALELFYPELRDVQLRDYKVRVLTGEKGTASKVRVLIVSGDHEREWNTVGVSDNIIDASWQALADSIELCLLREHMSKPRTLPKKSPRRGHAKSRSVTRTV
ncbi:MAG TPA: citramalate synthase [Nitrospirales bacterium]|nr:citramalate synthase [Nitrospirales bacterium]